MYKSKPIVPRKLLLFILVAAVLTCSFSTNKPLGQAELPKGYALVAHRIVVGPQQAETLYQVVDSLGMPQYYYKEIQQFPCPSDKVCRLMRLRMYWDAQGHYLQYQLKDGETLSKLNHKEFSEKDYLKLHGILNNPASELRFCQYSQLTSSQCEDRYHVDAVSGATSEDLSFEYINGAIKTTYTLWRLAHGPVAQKAQQLSRMACSPANTPHQAAHWYKAYAQAPLPTKLGCLGQLRQANTQLSDTAAQGLLAELPKANNALFSSLVHTLAQCSPKLLFAKGGLAQQLGTCNYYKQMVIYNALQQAGKRRMLKKLRPNFRELQL